MSEDRESDSHPTTRDERAFFTALGLRAEAQPLQPGLHIVATPIGNLGDITFRAVATLAAADTIVAEDTRVTKVLLAHYGISTPLVTYHEHNAETMRPHLLARLRGGAALALVSDAGTPLVSDPGFKLVAEALAENLPVIPIPGASAVLAALVVAGLPTDRFFFEGFLPPKQAARRARIADLAGIPGTLVFFESGRRVAETLVDLAEVLGRRDAVLARELTKHYETVRRAPLPVLAEEFATNAPRGEIVLLVAPPSADPVAVSSEEVDAKIEAALARMTVKDASAVVAAETGLPRRQIYGRAVELSAARRTASGD